MPTGRGRAGRFSRRDGARSQPPREPLASAPTARAHREAHRGPAGSL